MAWKAPRPTRGFPRLVVPLAAGAILLGGCGDADGGSQTRVVVDTVVVSKEDTATITPLERGKIRRDILAVTEPGLAAWLANDTDELAKYFADDFVAAERERQASYRGEGKTRVRSHSETFLDVTDINQAGDQAIVTYDFTDDSYFESADGSKLTEPTHKETQFQFTVELEGDTWTVVRVVGGKDSLQ